MKGVKGIISAGMMSTKTRVGRETAKAANAELRLKGGPNMGKQLTVGGEGSCCCATPCSSRNFLPRPLLGSSLASSHSASLLPVLFTCLLSPLITLNYTIPSHLP